MYLTKSWIFVITYGKLYLSNVFPNSWLVLEVCSSVVLLVLCLCMLAEELQPSDSQVAHNI